MIFLPIDIHGRHKSVQFSLSFDLPASQNIRINNRMKRDWDWQTWAHLVPEIWKPTQALQNLFSYYYPRKLVKNGKNQ